MDLFEPNEISVTLNLWNVLKESKDSHPELKYWNFDGTEPVLNKPVELHSEEGLIVQEIFRKHCYSYEITSINLIQNPYLMTAYLLKKAATSKQLECEAETRWLFHGTKQANTDKITSDNFNRRLCKAHKFGWGVSFSPDAYYASHYSDEDDDDGTKEMILAHVITGKVSVGNEGMKVPDGDSETSINHDGKVFVKYDDDTFYPAYVLKIYGKKRYYDDIFLEDFDDFNDDSDF